MRILFNYDGSHRPDLGVRSVLRSLHLSEETGILRLRGSALPQVDLYFHEGMLVACTSDLDDERILQRAMDLGGWDRRQMDKLREGGRDIPLLQLFQQRNLLEEAQLQGIAERCVRDNLRLALGTRWREAAFEHEDAVFPDCVSLELQTEDWLDDDSGEPPLEPPGETSISTEYHYDRHSLRDHASLDGDDDPDGTAR